MSRRRDWGAGEFGTTSSVGGVPRGDESGTVSGWHVCENELPVGKSNHVNEALFALSNGYIGVRGTFEEGYFGPADESGAVPSEQGIFINGFYEDHIIKYPEVGFGQAEKESVMLNVINSKIITIHINDEHFNMWDPKATVNAYNRELNLSTGTLTREVVWTSPKGHMVKVEAVRMVPLDPERKHIYVTEIAVTPLSDGVETIEFISEMDGEVTNKPQSKDPRVGAGFSGQVLLLDTREINQSDGTQEGYSYIKSHTTASDLHLVCAMKNTLSSEGKRLPMKASLEPAQKVREVCRVPAKHSVPVVLTKYVSYVSTQTGGFAKEDIVAKAAGFLAEAAEAGLETLKAEQKAFLDDFWSTADIEITGDEHLQQGLRFNIFHLVQGVGRDGHTNIGAKGITGEGYCGHYFWDTEIYILPFFLYTKPEIARKLIEFRIQLLDKARARARQLGGITRGALYPWRTINGDECSSYFPAGTAQLHINSDIAWAFKQYMEATDDVPLLLGGGAEMIVEMARFWMEYGSFGPGGHFDINCVTGPDEYTALVNNNYYTNIMVQDALNYVVDVCYMLKHEYTEDWERLTEKIGLQCCELDEMKLAAEKMSLPYDKQVSVHPQDDSFLQKKAWDFENTPADKYPLLLNYHYLVIYKYKVIKQADLVLSLLLQGDKFTDKEKKSNYDYYEPLTTHDSSLSTAVYSVMAAEIGYYQKAYNYFACTARMDLDNIHHNSQNGIHTACMAGTWMCVVRGFAGLRVTRNVLHLNPYLPQEWKGYKFSLTFHGAVLQVEVNARTVIYKAVKSRINFVHANTQKLYLKEGKSKELLLKDKFEDLTSLSFDSVVIDIDAALPQIQMAHFTSWRSTIALLVEKHPIAGKTPEFTLSHYKEYLQNQISQQSRFEGLRQFAKVVLDIDLPVGNSHDPPGTESLWALGNMKTEVLQKSIGANPPQPSEHFMRFVKSLHAEGIKIGVVSYSKSGEKLIDNSGLKTYIEAYVTGADMGVLGLRGKPHLDMYQRVVEQLFTEAKRCVVIIDDPLGFDYEDLTRFKYSISAPLTAQLMQTEGFDLTDLEEQHLDAGINKVLPELGTSPLDIDLLDAWVEEKEKVCVTSVGL